MEHHQFEMQVAAILAASLIKTRGVVDPAEAVNLLGEVHQQITSRSAIEKKNAAFIPKAR